MSTEINIKKRIDIQEEGVSITPDVNSINFVGDGVTASAIGDDVTVNIPGGMGTVTYYLNESVTQAPYKEFTSILTASAEQTILTSVASGATVTVQSFQTPSGVPGTTNIPGGRWAFYLHFSGTTGDSWDVFTEVYKRDLGGIETLLLTTDAIPTSTLTGTAVMLLTDGVFPASTVLTTDRIVVKVRVTNTDVTTNSITFHTEGSTNYSIATTTLNQVIPTGAVTSVTGTAPIASSGGTTPAISISQSGAASDGYLSSTDWNTFNNKVDDNIYTADGTVTGTRIVDLNGNTIKFDDGSLGINTTPSTALHVNALAVPAGEAVARFGVTDSSGYAQIANGTGTNNVFAPLLQGRQVGTSLHSAIGTEGIIDPVDDTGTTPITLFKARLSNFTSPVTRPLFQFTSWTFDLMTMLANGNIGIGTATPTEKLDVNGKTKTTNFQMTTTPTAGYVLTSDASGNGTWSAAAGGLTYFTEAQNTAAPNATVPVDSLTAVSATTDADFALRPKGTGALLAAIPDNTSTGGNKRGTRAVDLQTFRSSATMVASGQSATISGGETNTASGSAATVGGGASNVSSNFRTVVSGGILNTASGVHATVAGGFNNVSSGEASFTVGQANIASGQGSTATGISNTAGGGFSFAGGNGSVASGAYGFAFGYFTTAGGAYSYAIGRNASAINESYAFGWNVNASGQYSTALGTSTVASGQHSTAMGLSSSTLGIYGRQTYASGQEAVIGDSQASKFVLHERTTNNTATTLTTNSSAALTNNQVILSNQSAYRFKGTIIAKVSGTTGVSAWDIDGLIVRGANAASTTLLVGNVNVVYDAIVVDSPPTLAADTTNGGLRVQVTGALANIQWTATIETTEVIYA